MSDASGPDVAMSAGQEEAFYRMNGLEVACGWVLGTVSSPAALPTPVASVIEAMETAIRPALERPPCVVLFSGGRDSSLVLAVAINLARREGLPEPVARTHVFPALEETDEDGWQQMVIDHLGVRQWDRVELGDELDLVGPVAGPSLRRHGLLWPPQLHTRALDLAVARRGSLLDGEGGDEVLGAGRLSVVRALRSGLVGLDRSTARALVGAFAPRPVRRRVARRHYRRELRSPWLRPVAWRRLEDALVAQAAGEPLDRRRSLLRHARSRSVVMFGHNARLLASAHDVLDVHPLLDDGVVASVAAAGGRLGFAGRTTALNELFPGLLPDELVRRTSKARFNRMAFGAYSRAFAERWDGDGVDGELVDADELKAAWQADQPSALSFALLQSAWLAQDAS